MKKLLTLAAMFTAIALSSCKYDDDDLWSSVHGLEDRVAKLEELCKQMNTNIVSLQAIVNVLQESDYITGVAPVMQDGKEVGYIITFSKSNPVTIYHGKDGQDGEDGTDGNDGTTPSIGVKQDTDGIYYWTLNGEWLTDDQGEKIKAEGVDGNDGTDGDDGVTPKFKIENEYWYISYNNGESWEQLGKATGGESTGGDSMFTDIDYKTSTDYVIFTLADGTQIKLPTWSAFEALQRLCNETNTNLSSLQAIVTALQNNDYITSVDPLTENGKVVGYTIKFAKSNPIVIYNGKDGADGNTPVIGIKKDTDGIYYWTLDGEFILVDGHKIQAQGDGNGTTPKLEIRNGYWWVSYDNGQNWEQLGKATGEDGKDGESIKITQDENNVYFELEDGTVITISKSSSNIHFDDSRVKSICVENWDTNKDGELSFEEAAAVISIQRIFSNNKYIESFDELKYFTQITTIDHSAFANCENLWQITLPANITSIETDAFYKTALTAITIPKKVQSIGASAFKDCEALSNVTFEKGSMLQEIKAPEMSGAFENCTQLTTIELPASLISLSGGVFKGCRSLQKVSFEENSQLQNIIVTRVYQYNTPFGYCTALKEFDASNCSNLSYIDDYAFVSEVKTDKSIIPLNIQVVSIGAITPPTCKSYAFTSESTYEAELVVPKGCLNKYKNVTGWNKFSSVSEYTD
ncbi:PL29 family lyase N-terminal domain-containing protein [uncultured Alistipes sp.]|uniref:PL29 family lyase N-terminal domain-containing protein n=1 Tax=uncultured Alistipes sp. TaxID=538949 RepID=UPI002635CA1E|nr:PL29 family lyase N-terminal domain-containing protein [uncultured Alistipes sp.]